MEEDICFAVMLSLVSPDPLFQIWRSRCWVSCAGAVFCAFERFKGWEWATIHTILNDNTLATIFQLSRVGFVFIQMSITTWKQGKNLLNFLKSVQLALRAVIWGWIQITLHKSLNWSKVVIVWPSGCCFASKWAPLKNKAKNLLMIDCCLWRKKTLQKRRAITIFDQIWLLGNGVWIQLKMTAGTANWRLFKPLKRFLPRFSCNDLHLYGKKQPLIIGQ